MPVAWRDNEVVRGAKTAAHCAVRVRENQRREKRLRHRRELHSCIIAGRID